MVCYQQAPEEEKLKLSSVEFHMDHIVNEQLPPSVCNCANHLFTTDK